MSGHRRKVGDTHKPIDITLSPATVDIAGALVRVIVKSTTAIVIDRAPTVVATTNPPTLSLPVMATDFVAEGDYQCEVEVTFPSGKIQTFPEIGFLSIRVVKDLR